MTIDWDKKLECEYGEIHYASPVAKSNSMIEKHYWVVLDCSLDGLQGASWTVKQEGTPIDPWMPRVYNTKRKPKKGEYWVCKDIDEMERVLYCDGYMYLDGPELNEAYLEVTPLYPLIKDPSFE